MYDNTIHGGSKNKTDEEESFSQCLKTNDNYSLGLSWSGPIRHGWSRINGLDLPLVINCAAQVNFAVIIDNGNQLGRLNDHQQSLSPSHNNVTTLISTNALARKCVNCLN